MSRRLPDDLRYTKEHEWARIDGDDAPSASPSSPSTRSATSSTSSCPRSGQRIEKDAAFGEVESVKAVSDLFAPVSGEVRRGERAARRLAENVNEDRYGEGWLVRIQLTEPEGRRRPHVGDQYDAYLKEQVAQQ